MCVHNWVSAVHMKGERGQSQVCIRVDSEGHAET